MTMLTEAYRPKSLSEVIGQDRVKRMVSAAITTDRMPRSILLSGEFSSGKTTFARIIARLSLCVNRAEAAACGTCRSCLMMEKGNHPDFIEVDAASDRGIDAMRGYADRIRMMPIGGSKKKVLLLDEAHQITPAGWQAMLKTLEEPPLHVIIIVATTNPEKLPETIRSRLSPMKLQAVTVDECVELLSRVAKDKGLAKAGITKEHLLKVAKVVHAHPRNALHALDQVYTLSLAAQSAGQALDAALVNGFIDQVAVTAVETTALAIVRSVLEGKPGGAMKRAEDNMSEADQLLYKIIGIFRQAVLLANSPKLMDPYFREGFADLSIFAPEYKADAKFAILEAYEAFVRLRIDTANYAVSVSEILDATICRAGFVIQKYLSKKLSGATVKKEVEAVDKTVAQHTGEPKPAPKAEEKAEAVDSDGDFKKPKKTSTSTSVRLTQ